MKRYRFAAETAVEFEVESAFHWYETEEVGLGFEFLHNFAPAINDYCARPSVTELRSGVRRALTKQFPYAVYFPVEGDTVVILTVVHTARDLAEWQHGL